MAESNQQNKPPCGLCFTSQEIQVGDTQIEKNQLLYFHNHSDQGVPVLIFPTQNTGNKWAFDHPVSLQDVPTVMKSLVRLKPEGLYRLTEHVHLNDKETINKNALVQLGYTARGEPILFYPEEVAWGNALSFPMKGQRISGAIYKLLEPLDVHGPYVKEAQ